MKKILLTIFLCFSLAISAAFAQTRQQALDEIARIERFDAQIPEMLRQAWETGRTQKETVIDTPYGKVTIKFNLAEEIREHYTGDMLSFKLKDWHGVSQGNEIRINNDGSWRNTESGRIGTITHELGHWMDKTKSTADVRRAEIEADAFAMRYLGKKTYTDYLKESSYSQSYLDEVINRAEEMEREERENLARLRVIANAPATAAPPAAAALPPAAAVAQNPPNVNAVKSFADSAIAAFGRKEYDKAIADFTKAIELDPANLYFNCSRGVAYFEKGDYDRAIADFNQMLRIAPNFAEAYVNRGIAYYKKNELDKAMADHNQAIRIDPNDEEVKNVLGKVRELKQMRQ